MNQLGLLCANPEFEHLKALHCISLGMYHLLTDSFHSSKYVCFLKSRLHLAEAFNLANTLYPTDQLRLLSLIVFKSIKNRSCPISTNTRIMNNITRSWSRFGPLRNV